MAERDGNRAYFKRQLDLEAQIKRLLEKKLGLAVRRPSSSAKERALTELGRRLDVSDNEASLLQSELFATALPRQVVETPTSQETLGDAVAGERQETTPIGQYTSGDCEESDKKAIVTKAAEPTPLAAAKPLETKPAGQENGKSDVHDKMATVKKTAEPTPLAVAEQQEAKPAGQETGKSDVPDKKATVKKTAEPTPLAAAKPLETKPAGQETGKSDVPDKKATVKKTEEPTPLAAAKPLETKPAGQENGKSDVPDKKATAKKTAEPTPLATAKPLETKPAGQETGKSDVPDKTATVKKTTEPTPLAVAEQQEAKPAGQETGKSDVPDKKATVKKTEEPTPLAAAKPLETKPAGQETGKSGVADKNSTVKKTAEPTPVAAAKPLETKPTGQKTGKSDVPDKMATVKKTAEPTPLAVAEQQEVKPAGQETGKSDVPDKKATVKKTAEPTPLAVAEPQRKSRADITHEITRLTHQQLKLKISLERHLSHKLGSPAAKTWTQALRNKIVALGAKIARLKAGRKELPPEEHNYIMTPPSPTYPDKTASSQAKTRLFGRKKIQRGARATDGGPATRFDNPIQGPQKSAYSANPASAGLRPFPDQRVGLLPHPAAGASTKRTRGSRQCVRGRGRAWGRRPVTGANTERLAGAQTSPPWKRPRWSSPEQPSANFEARPPPVASRRKDDERLAEADPGLTLVRLREIRAAKTRKSPAPAFFPVDWADSGPARDILQGRGAALREERAGTAPRGYSRGDPPQV